MKNSMLTWSLPYFLIALLLIAVASCTLGDVIASDPVASPDRIEFNRDIRPILSDRCFSCHGPDKNKREAETRLDTLEGLHGSTNKTGPLVPGNPDASEMIRRIESLDNDKRMPPPEFAKDLSEHEKALLRKWIQQGAKWEGHWAFQPIRSTPAPKIIEERFSRNALDGHIFAALRQAGLEPSSKADARTLVRRLCFDLTGLPPKPEWVERFTIDPSDEAYEKLVDELIKSPQFGERMAVWWLDLVRYADSVGYHGDQPVPVTPFRDYVIDAFNDNKPFDRFTIEQLAGDLFPEPTTEHLIASGYNRLGMMSAEGGAQPKEYLSKYIAERVRNVSGAWLGVTFGCCECHDHKFDPFPTKEFYQLEAFFADIQEKGLYSAGDKTDPWGPEIAVPNPEQKQSMKELSTKIENIRKFLDTPTDALANSQVNWEKEQVAWKTLKSSAVTSLNGATLIAQEDASILASGKNPNTDTYEITFSDVPEFTAIRIEVLPHDSLPKKGPGRAGDGNFVLSEFEAYWQSPVDKDKPLTEDTPITESIPLQNATATFEQVGSADGNPYGKWAVAAAIDRDAKGPTWGWGVMEQVGHTNYAVFELDPSAPQSANRQLKLVLKQNLDNAKHTMGRFRIATTNAVRPVTAATGVPPEIESVLQVTPSERTGAQREQIAKHYRSIAPELQSEREHVERLTKELDLLDKSVPRTLITKRVEPRTIRVHPRGNWMDESGEVVEPGIPAILGKRPEVVGRLTRMDLAKWIVSPDNPLTSRVAVNRLWKLFFGYGLSRKLDDLGAQGDWPTHPELLDMLAAEFMNSGWDMKHIVKLMVMSETYKQSSLPNAAVSEKDPYNKWLSHQGRWRLDAEFVRDNAMAISGLLVQSVGKNNGRPFQPKGYWDYLNFPKREWQKGVGEQLYRRGLYTHWQRQYLHPSLLAFDAPGREECTAERTRSNTPLQALVLLNDPIYVESARAFAQRILESGQSTDEERVEWAIRDSLCRKVVSNEAQLLLSLLNKHRAEYVADTASADRLLSVGDYPIASDLNRTELAAWTSVARAILNLHETITRN